MRGFAAVLTCKIPLIAFLGRGYRATINAAKIPTEPANDSDGRISRHLGGGVHCPPFRRWHGQCETFEEAKDVAASTLYTGVAATTSNATATGPRHREGYSVWCS